jgi:hypothetical protein
MQERAHLVHGSFSVESKPGEGTRIFAAMPFVAEDESSPKDAPDKKAGQLSLERPAEEAVMVNTQTLLCRAGHSESFPLRRHRQPG